MKGRQAPLAWIQMLGADYVQPLTEPPIIRFYAMHAIASVARRISTSYAQMTSLLI
jgi:hypothetical protein